MRLHPGCAVKQWNSTGCCACLCLQEFLGMVTVLIKKTCRRASDLRTNVLRTSIFPLLGRNSRRCVLECRRSEWQVGNRVHCCVGAVHAADAARHRTVAGMKSAVGWCLCSCDTRDATGAVLSAGLYVTAHAARQQAVVVMSTRCGCWCCCHITDAAGAVSCMDLLWIFGSDVARQQAVVVMMISGLFLLQL